MTFALGMVIDRIEARIAALDVPADPRERAERVLAELLPMDAERRAENEVWLAFTARAMVDPALGALRDEGYDRLREGCRGLALGLVGVAEADLDIDLETERLHALVDGLAVHAAMRPDINTPDMMRGVIARHLDELTGRPAPRR